MHHIGRFGIESSSVISDDVIISPSATLQGINYMENKSYEEYFSGLTPQQQKMIKQGLASIKEWGQKACSCPLLAISPHGRVGECVYETILELLRDF